MQPISPADCAALIRGSRSIAALTGAGISTAAGIPDFRGPKGLYVTRRYDPEKTFEVRWFRRKPRWFYQFSNDFVAAVKDIQPTFSHRFLAELERAGQLAGIITQNIDMLHQRAGSRNVIELHGSYGSATCMGCGKVFTGLDYAFWQQAMTDSSDAPVVHCSCCDAVLKPDIVFFGEMVNQFDRAEQLVQHCDLLLVLGSSLQVAPASQLPYSCRAPIVVVNRGQVALPPGEERYFVDADLDGYFAQCRERLGMG
ncbi:RNA polymerase subunit sigma [Geothermobacter hydrogeniphilus]|uniref:protein acetyllysine N-acetyltransferase n=1 Tax=Geothermobacter hydrogeniphilus TaxID=1969733 RepID=A0A2K2H996_9BACT|nr:Sir2 family NAD-dependent protein deacetylase [Geothermobacter hydrogeniphilus]PNU19882.1 RNA polymerase subunit sigma [Geothermobacter hydrogeniphilus]